jgi:trigger factor
LSSVDTVETAAPAAEGADEHAHEHGGEHAHPHQHGPALNPELRREVEVEVGAEEVSKAFAQALKRYTKQVRLPGFRAGKVPPSLIRSRFADQIRQEVVEAVLPRHFEAAVNGQGVRPISQPQMTALQLQDGEPMRFKAEFEIAPTIDLAGYQDVRVEVPSAEVTDEELEAEVERVRDSRSTMEPVEEERPLQDGDWAQITFKGEPEALPEGVADAHPVDEPIEGEDVAIEVGGKNTLPAFTEALRGASVGQELKFEAQYPADFGEPRLAGKTISYDVKVTGIKRRIAPELNDEFAKELGEYETFDEFRTKLREHLLNDKKGRVAAEAKDKLLGALAEKYPFAVPYSFVEQQIDFRLERGLRALAQQGMTEEQMRQLDFRRLREAQRAAAEGEVKGTMLLDRIAAEENVQVTDEELERELQILSMQNREPLETLRTRLAGDGSLERLRDQVRREKVGNLLYERLGA